MDEWLFLWYYHFGVDKFKPNEWVCVFVYILFGVGLDGLSPRAFNISLWLGASEIITISPGSRPPENARIGATVGCGCWVGVRVDVVGVETIGFRFPDLGVAEGGFVLKRCLMRFVLHVDVWGKLQYPLDGVAQTFGDFAIAGVAIPDADNVFGVTDADYGSTNLSICHAGEVGPTNEGQNNLLPVTTGQSLTQTDDPLPSLRVIGVLPGRLDALTKEMIIRSRGQVVGPHQKVVATPELFHRLYSGYYFYGVLVRMNYVRCVTTTIVVWFVSFCLTTILGICRIFVFRRSYCVAVTAAIFVITIIRSFASSHVPEAKAGLKGRAGGCRWW